MAEKDIIKYLPLSEATYYILLALVEPLHGYGIMQKVEGLSEGTVSIGPGTMYGAFTTLEKQGLITMVKAQVLCPDRKGPASAGRADPADRHHVPQWAGCSTEIIEKRGQYERRTRQKIQMVLVLAG